MTTHAAQLDGSPERDAAQKRAGRRWWLLLVWGLGGATLLVIVPVVALLGLVAITNIADRGIGARRMTTTQSMNVIASALKQYQLQYSAYPPTLATLTPKFLETTPIDAWNRPYVYAPTPIGANPYTLYSTGATANDVIDHWKPAAAE